MPNDISLVPRRVISLKTEEIAWETLDALVSKRLSASEIELDFSEASWARIHLVFNGGEFDQTVLPSIMKGIVELQNNFYHAISLFLNNDARTIRLSFPQRDRFEFIFKVGKGSSDLDAPVDKIMEALRTLGEPLVRGLGSYQKTVIIIVIALLFASSFALPKYLEFAKDTKSAAEATEAHLSDNQREAGLQELASKYADDDREKFRIFADAMKSVKSVKTVAKESVAVYDSVLRQAYKADQLTIQGRSVSRTQLDEIAKRTRRPSESVTFRALFTVDAVDTTADNGFVVTLKNVQTGEVVSAALEERLARAKYGRVIRKAEWSKSPASVQISGKRIGTQLKEGKILAASIPRAKS